jgi:hypothetical protein
MQVYNGRREGAVAEERVGIFLPGGGELLHQSDPANCAKFRRGYKTTEKDTS